MPRKKKHAMEMTDDEALKHIFHPKIANAVRKHLKGQSDLKPKPQVRQKRKAKS